MKRKALILLSLIFAIFAIYFYSAAQTTTANVTLAWDANTESDLAGYKLYWGTASGTYPNSVDVGNVTQHTLTGLPLGQTLYFVATAYDTADPPNESNYSNEINYTTPEMLPSPENVTVREL